MAFTLATWNILATSYIRPEFYSGSPRHVLDPACRVPEVVRRAIALDTDILCLQEVEVSVFAALQTGLAGSGYSGRHALKGANRPDGCATFFRSSRFTLAHTQRIAFADGDGRADSGHIAQLLLLDREGKRLAVLNTHLKWDAPDTPRERQWGYRQIVQSIEALRTEAGPSAGQIVCGDFNVTPHSDAVEALLSAGFDYAHRHCGVIVTCNSNGQPKLIDYLFHSQSLRGKRPSPRSSTRNGTAVA